MTDLTQDLILAALTNVKDPSQGRDIVALGMVTGLQIKDSNISFALQVPAHRGPHGRRPCHRRLITPNEVGQGQGKSRTFEKDLPSLRSHHPRANRIEGGLS